MNIPILMYHSVDSASSNLSVSVKNFDDQMKFLKKKKFKTISLDKIEDADVNEKYFVITFDDGYESVFHNALPILKKYNFKATCFLVTEFIGKYNIWDINKKNYIKQNLMNNEQIKKWVNNGMNVGSHTLTHANLRELSIKDKEYEISESFYHLNNKLSLNINTFSYPFGSYDDDSKNFVKKLYKFGLTTKRSRFIKNKFHNSLLPRVPINKKDNILKFYIKTHTFYEDIKFKNNN